MCPGRQKDVTNSSFNANISRSFSSVFHHLCLTASPARLFSPSTLWSIHFSSFASFSGLPPAHRLPVQNSATSGNILDVLTLGKSSVKVQSSFKLPGKKMNVSEVEKRLFDLIFPLLSSCLSPQTWLVCFCCFPCQQCRREELLPSPTLPAVRNYHHLSAGGLCLRADKTTS